MGSSSSKVAVSELNEYPVKSCAATKPLAVGRVTSHGFQHDRILQVSDKDAKFCTPREEDKARLFYVAADVDANEVLTLKADDDTIRVNLGEKTSKTTVEIISEETKPLEDYGEEVASWLEKHTGIPGCRLTGIGSEFQRQPVINEDQGDPVPQAGTDMSLADEAPFLLTNEASLEDLNRRLSARGKNPVDMRRFRPNIVIKGLKPWEEDCLSKIRIGGVEFHVWQRCGRCTMTTIDRDTLERGPEPLATLSTFRERAHGQRNFGMHMIPLLSQDGPFEIKLGDEVEILEFDEDRRSEWKRLFG